jgi:hypothetical protein
MFDIDPAAEHVKALDLGLLSDPGSTASVHLLRSEYRTFLTLSHCVWMAGAIDKTSQNRRG